ncbi:MAG: hypothetical protein LBV59_15575 [Sphingobacterium sp.]|jgi:hypothetical protein|uniref:hypothetical protein n=1 Tax=unclassified Sphingobacterium TaxID=2609468 RepID=UPI00284A9502|nr:hypothetical protein [Sphingobacterium sp.]MDR3009356.1 hypothetical protein [Sphingobacterium sp.]
MIKSLLVSITAMLCMNACAQEPTSIKKNAAAKWVPFQTKNKQFVYVDSTFNKKLPQQFYWAQPFTSTGYALVANEKDQMGIINSKGEFIENYSEAQVELLDLGQLTLAMKRQEYDKNLPFWKWDWNILSSYIKKTGTYVKLEIRVLESNQVLLKKDIPYDENEYNLVTYPLDTKHLVLNGNLYLIKDQRLKKIEGDIEMPLENGRYIPASTDSFTIHDIQSKKPLLSNLTGLDKIDLLWKNETILLDSINQERFSPTIPKLLKDHKTGSIYAFPQYDKAFPKQIKQATAAQIAFLKEISLVYSVTNSPYFILGRFNYDHAVWAYDWLYIDKDGNLLDSIKAPNFYILDQVGNLVWPDKLMLLPANALEKNWKTGKIKYVYSSEDLYLIDVKRGDLEPTKGLWNAVTKAWDIKPGFEHIEILDGERQIFALQEHKDGLYTLYNNKTKQHVGNKSYMTINPNGWVKHKNQHNQDNGYFIDIVTGQEYKE